MKNKKVNLILIIFLLLIFIILLSLIIYYIKTNNSCKELYENQITQLQADNLDLQDTVLSLKEQISSFKSKTCKYIRTYRYVDDYKYIFAEDSTKRYIVVDQFQEFIPIILEYNSNLIDVIFEKNSNYEITFESTIINGIEVKKRITNIQKTDKIGFNQIQENC